MPQRTGPGRPPSYCGTRCRLDAQRERESLWRVVGQAALAAVEQRREVSHAGH
jgi:hypothetical protein